MEVNDSSAPTSLAPVAELDENTNLEDYLAYAALHNPALEGAFERWKAALTRIPQISALPDPRFNYTYFIEEVETRVGPQRQKFALSQTFPWLGKLELAGSIAGMEAQAQRERYEQAKRQLFYTVKSAYYEYYYFGKALAVTNENLALLETLEEVARSQYETGRSPYGAVISFQVEIGKVKDQLLALQESRGPLMARLNAAMNRPVNARLLVPQSLPEQKIDVSDERLTALLEDHNPELAAWQHMIDKENIAIDLARKDSYPDVTLGIGAIDTRNAVSPISDSGEDPLFLTLSINLPLWRDKYRAAVIEAQVRHQLAIHVHQDRQNTLQAQLRQALYDYHNAERKLDLYANRLIPLAEENGQVTQREFAAGQAEFLDMIDVVRTLLEFNLSYERALGDRGRHLAMIEMIIGQDLPSPSQEK